MVTQVWVPSLRVGLKSNQLLAPKLCATFAISCKKNTIVNQRFYGRGIGVYDYLLVVCSVPSCTKDA